MLRGHGCRFLVAGRRDEEGGFSGLEQVALPAGCAELFEGIDEQEFRLDVSSTQRRQGWQRIRDH